MIRYSNNSWSGRRTLSWFGGLVRLAIGIVAILTIWQCWDDQRRDPYQTIEVNAR